MKKLITKVSLWLGCGAIMLLVGTLTVAFYVFMFVRKLFVKGFVPNAKKAGDLMGSAQSQLNAFQANEEKKVKSAPLTIKHNLSRVLWSRVFKVR